MSMNGWQFFFRWLHVIAGITWIGHLYFFNFVNGPFQASIDDATKKAANPQLQPRALWWFRWGAMVTLLSGLALYYFVFMTGVRAPTPWIMMGMTFGVIMWFNVWFIIWPTNRKLMLGQIPAENVAKRRRIAYLASRTNTYLSGPLIFGMLGSAGHGGDATVRNLIIACICGFAAIYVAIFHSTKVGKSV